MNTNDPRSLTGIYARGKNVYNGTASSPNPTGTNQFKFDPQRAAKLRRKKLQQSDWKGIK